MPGRWPGYLIYRRINAGFSTKSMQLWRRFRLSAREFSSPEIAVEGKLTPRNLTRLSSVTLYMKAETKKFSADDYPPERIDKELAAPHRTISRLPDGTPGPRSAMATRTQSLLTTALRMLSVSSGLYLMALDSRLTSVCLSLSASVSIAKGRGPLITTSNCRPFSSALGPVGLGNHRERFISVVDE